MCALGQAGDPRFPLPRFIILVSGFCPRGLGLKEPILQGPLSLPSLHVLGTPTASSPLRRACSCVAGSLELSPSPTRGPLHSSRSTSAPGLPQVLGPVLRVKINKTFGSAYPLHPHPQWGHMTLVQPLSSLPSPTVPYLGPPLLLVLLTITNQETSIKLYKSSSALEKGLGDPNGL